ncbi:hypothetical protein AWR36_001430 [Microbulbifer flavimaris]|uniref:Secreted protein n=1 Tax=Microbulbifer flavimaris TaxID=1781068 RepID=A0ABX4I2B2_9GAMM|nr:hypothetical protein AVO43_01435 [Microbulbifer sp. ZGT114]PCO06476.1 hypothetical protein AWR36_001430 [Microbulbifer flavimaris]
MKSGEYGREFLFLLITIALFDTRRLLTAGCQQLSGAFVGGPGPVNPQQRKRYLCNPLGDFHTEKTTKDGLTSR